MTPSPSTIVEGGGRLASGVFLGRRSIAFEVGGFKAGLWRASLPPDEVQPHTHDDAHFVLALDGGYRSLGHDPQAPGNRIFGPGSLIWNPPGVEHRDSFEAPGGRFLSVSFMPPAGATRGHPRRIRQDIAQTAARRVVGSLARLRDGDAVELEGWLLDLASTVLSAAEVDEDPAPEWVARADQIIKDLAGQSGLQVRDVARLAGGHPVALARRYRRHFGLSPATAIRMARADRAATLAVKGVDLAELAVRCGYADQSHLTRDLRAFYGMTPARCRTLFG